MNSYLSDRALDIIGMCAVVDDCWVFTGSATGRGYGVVSRNGKSMSAHKLVYLAEVGPVPDGLQLDHLCNNPRCVKPSHLRPCTAKENGARNSSPPSENARKTHCSNGHPLSGENLYLCWYSDGRFKQRRCLACERVYRTKRRSRRGNA